MRKCFVFVLFALLIAGAAYGDWVKEYHVGVNGWNRGVAVSAEDDFATQRSSTPKHMMWFHNAPAAFDCADTVWECPHHVGETITIASNWGMGIDGDDNVYLWHQDPQASVLVWDYNCNEVDRFETGVDPSGSEYGTALDVDGNGYVYLTWYIASGAEVAIYPPMPWYDTNHIESPVATVATGAYVAEGVCVNQAGTVLYATNRSAPGTNGWCKRFTAPGPAGPWTQDLLFAGDGTLDIDGYVSGVDLDESYGPNGRIFVIHRATSPSNYIVVADALTGAVIETIDYEGITGYYSPYDVEYHPGDSKQGGDLYVADRDWWRTSKLHEEPPTAVTMSSFEAIGAEEQVELTWRVESEADNAGYRIYRDGEPVTFVEGRGNSDSPLTYTWIDKDVTAGTTYRYRIADVDVNGNETVHDFVVEATPKPAASGQVPTSYALYQNYPNPFNADTHIRFTLAEAGHTTLKIYNTTGQLVATLVDGHMDARTHEVRWDGRNAYGEMVASGVYFYRLSSGTFAETKKMSFLR